METADACTIRSTGISTSSRAGWSGQASASRTGIARLAPTWPHCSAMASSCVSSTSRQRLAATSSGAATTPGRPGSWSWNGGRPDDIAAPRRSRLPCPTRLSGPAKGGRHGAGMADIGGLGSGAGFGAAGDGAPRHGRRGTRHGLAGAALGARPPGHRPRSSGFRAGRRRAGAPDGSGGAPASLVRGGDGRGCALHVARYTLPAPELAWR